MKKMTTKKTGMKKMVALAVVSALALTAVPALAMPETRAGAIGGTSEIRFSDMTVNHDGTLSVTLQNTSGRDAIFNGRVAFRSDEGIQAESQLMTGVPVGANGSTQVTLSLEKGDWQDYKASNVVAWSGVRVEGEGRTITRADETRDPYVN